MKRALAGLLCVVLCLALVIPSASADSLDDLILRIQRTEQLAREAREQCEAEDRTPLYSPATLRILWLGYTHAYYRTMNFRMDPEYLEYLYAVALNYEKTLETWANGSVDIEVDLYLIDHIVSLTRDSGSDFLYLSRETAQPDIDRYMQWKPYDSVITTIMSQGEKNALRNRDNADYGKIGPIYGLCTSGIWDAMSYSTFDLYEPFPGTYPVRDPYVPALDVTGAAIHEWEHTFDCLGEMLGVEFPVTHAYMGAPQFPGYRQYPAGNMDFTYLTLVFSASLPYSGEYGIRRVGMYPKMWRLLQRENLDFGTYTIRNAAGEYLSARRADPTLTLSQAPCRWKVRYAQNHAVILIPEDIPEWRIDLDNAWDEEGNRVKLIHNTGAIKAQSWILQANGDGTCCIRTACGSDRVLCIPRLGEKAVIRSPNAAPSSQTRWIFTPAG